jgi:hypothetical protein
MKKDFESRFMPDVKFKIPFECINQFNFGLINPCYAVISTDGSSLSHVFTDNEKYLFDNRIDTCLVSIYEAIPELIPDGMRYNRTLDKLVPDVISASNEYCSGIKVEFEKVLEYSEEILQRENGFIKADKEKINFSLVDPYAYEDLGKCLTIGAKKYSPDNWKLGDIESYIAALDRHLIDIKKAVLDKDKSLFIDKDTTLQHGANLLCNAMFIHYFIRKELEEK